MVDERDEYQGHEDGEYHFSDEHASYEIENETAKVDTTTKTAGVALASFNKYRRTVVVSIIVIVALLGVYKVLMPSYTPQSTDFAQAPTAATTVQPAKPIQQVAQAAPQSIAQPQPVAQQPTAVTQTAAITPAQPQAAPVQQQQAAAQQPTAPQPNMPAQPQTVNDRVAAIEDQNAKLANLLQIEYAQKMSDYSAQEASMQTKLQELSSRVANMEAVINQLTQLLQSTVKSEHPASAATSSNAARATAQRMSYVVQAIIPGRAWLKSDSGDTVTVAEGDSLKGYGRITKIDPYDGIVTIDTGGKTLTLSYGMSADS